MSPRAAPLSLESARQQERVPLHLGAGAAELQRDSLLFPPAGDSDVTTLPPALRLVHLGSPFHPLGQGFLCTCWNCTGIGGAQSSPTTAEVWMLSHDP